MAKKKLTTEEKLQAALVPEEEQPYKVPENWCWVRLGAITSIVGGGTPSSKVKEYYEDGKIPWLSPADLSGYEKIYISRGAKNITELGLEKSSAKLMPKDTVLLSSRAPIGYVAIAENEVCTNQGFKSFLPSSAYTPRYLYWYLKGAKNLLESYASGTTFLELSASKAAKVEFPLAPIEEQSRIVARIESLFAKLDEAKEKIQEVLDGADLRRAAILHQAFTGNLTEKWRRKNGVSDDSWEEKTLNSVCKSIFDGDHMPPPKTDEGIPFLVISNVNTGYLSFENTRYVSEEYYDKVSETRKPKKGDVLYTLVGSYGIPVVVDTDKPFCFQRHMGLMKPDCVDTFYLWYILQTREFYDKASKIAKGTAQLTVPIKGLRELTINVPSLLEQQEIVRLLDNLLSREQSTVTACKEALTTIDTLKKSILARAFRGELGTNDPSEASAKELLKEILA